MKKTISISEIISYCYSYKSGKECEFYFDLYDDSLLDDEYILRYSYNIIPMFYVIENEKIKEFLLLENNRKITKNLKKMSQSEAEGLFQTMFDYN
ncbi:MAG: hypothetical protein NC177_10445 [Ruminococcus flavefaciens]|nr:hypothetical protein [Ruminococcus flavefaciens]